jgi:hypothetical protein
MYNPGWRYHLAPESIDFFGLLGAFDTDVKIILVRAWRLLRGSGESRDSPGSPDV